MAESHVSVTEGTGSNVDTFTLASTGNKRQSVVIGDSSIDANVAPVQSTDPTSAQAGLVVRDVNTSAIVGVLNSGITISGDINRVRNVVDGTLSTIGRVNHLIDGTVTVTGITASIGVYFDRGNPSVQSNPIVGQTGVSAGVGVSGVQTPRVVLASDVVSSVNIMAIGTTNTLGVYLSSTAGTLGVNIGTISGTTAVYLHSTAGTIGVDVGKMQQADYVTRVRNVVDGTLTTVTGVDRVRNVVDGTLTTVTTVGRVNHLIDGTVTITGTNSSLAVFLDPGHLLGGVNVSQFNGGTVVTPNTGIPAVNVYSTANIFTVSGSTSGGTTSGVTLISPSANASFKVFAFSLQTTGIVGTVWRFCNGSAASQTEFFRGLATANQTASTPVGANLAIQPPGFLFATGVSTTLVLVSDTGSLVHYTVSYFKESA